MPTEKTAKILRADKATMIRLEARLSAISGKKKVFEKIVSENESLMRDRLSTLGVSREATAKEVYDALISKIESDDNHLFGALGNPNSMKTVDCQAVADAALRAAKNPKGFFMKIDRAYEFLLKEPPKKVMEFLKYGSAKEMLAKENIWEIMSALRFVEGSDWLNNVFFKQYEKLTPADFEERPVKILALDEKWNVTTRQFLLKKHHNISHLKELGVVFIIPALLGISGEVLRMFSLVLHYLNEIPFYSGIFRDIAENEKTFTANFTSLLRGDVVERKIPAEGEKSLWLVVQRYLSKDDENDWRLFVPHINPEAMHWRHAEEHLASIGNELDHFGKELSFWRDIDWVGDYFRDESGVEVLVSFDLVDTVMSLVKEKEMVKYLYHHQEALWNKIFIEYFGRDKLDEYSRKYVLQGYFEI